MMQPRWTDESAQEYLRGIIRIVNGQSRYQRPLARELIGKAFGRGVTEIWDMTCGLGVDAWTLCRLGYRVRSFERNPFLFDCLLKAKQEADNDPSWRPISARWTITLGDSFFYLAQETTPPEACYLDPMFVFTKNPTALPKKEMQALRFLLRHDEGNHFSVEEKLSQALDRVQKRVVLKWHRHLPGLKRSPNQIIDGNRIMFLIFFP
ncbi:MAG: class I SAM-dependent methyltransferase [Bdellovibrionaceae bacterium]|nr:class I SAM-dependent methyltransferase [Pseudobdellovibrionaceae bacterium]MDW8190099.1 class I SAM-dependent methyltransferase [Pseudobdellovibrionaceae bacterium]